MTEQRPSRVASAAGWLPLLALGAILLLRVEAMPFPLVAGAAGAVLLFALVTGRRTLPGTRRPAAITLLLATATALVGLVPDAFPCDVACRAGAEWASLFGVPTLAWAAGATLFAALLLRMGDARPGSTLATLPGEVVTRAAGGASLWFLALAWNLRMPCRLCCAVHLPVLAAAALLARGGASPAWLRGGALLFGALLTRQLFAYDLARSTGRTDVSSSAAPAAPPAALPAASTTAPDAVPDAPPDAAATALPANPEPPPAAALPPVDRELLAALDAARRFGATTPKLRVELVFAYNCGHCKETFADYLDALAPLGGDGQAQACVRFLHARKDAASRELSKLTIAAAHAGRLRERAASIWAARDEALAGGDAKGKRGGDMQAAVDRYFAREELTLARLKARATPAAADGGAAAADGAAEARADLAADLAFVGLHAATCEQWLRDEEAALPSLQGEGELPWLFLVDATSGERLAALPAGTTPRQLASAVRQRLR